MIKNDKEMGQVRTVSEVVNGSPSVIADVAIPTISTLNVTKSSNIHIGSKVVSVTQNVQNPNVVKGKIVY